MQYFKFQIQTDEEEFEDVVCAECLAQARQENDGTFEIIEISKGPCSNDDCNYSKDNKVIRVVATGIVSHQGSLPKNFNIEIVDIIEFVPTTRTDHLFDKGTTSIIKRMFDFVYDGNEVTLTRGD